MHTRLVSLPSVSFLGTVKSSSLVMCLCPNEPKDIVGMVVEDVAVTFDDDDNDGGNKGLHGEWELAEVLDEAANGTPVEGYKSWLN